MAAIKFVLTGDKQLNRALRDLPTRVATKFIKRALKPAAQMVLTEARSKIPVRTTNRKAKGKHPPGAWRDSLVVIPAKRSRRGYGFFVTQEGIAGRPEDSNIKGFYGAFQELGYFHTGRKRKAVRDSNGFVAKLANQFNDDPYNQRYVNKYQEITTYRKKDFTILQLRSARHMKPRWIMWKAAMSKQEQARDMFTAELKAIVNEEANGGK